MSYNQHIPHSVQVAVTDKEGFHNIVFSIHSPWTVEKMGLDVGSQFFRSPVERIFFAPIRFERFCSYRLQHRLMLVLKSFELVLEILIIQIPAPAVEQSSPYGPFDLRPRDIRLVLLGNELADFSGVVHFTFAW